MAIDFPNSPTIGDTYTTNGKTYRWDGTVWGVYGTFTVDSTASDTEPTGVGNGHIWYRSDQSQTLIRYNGTWVEVGSAGGFDSSSTNFPTSIDSGTGFAAVEALQAKVGVNSSGVATSHDYKIADHASRLTTLEALGTAVAFTPSWTNFTIGNGITDAIYVQIGDMVYVNVYVQLGSTSTMSSSPYFTAPVTIGGGTVRLTSGVGRARIGSFYWIYPYISAEDIYLYCVNTSGTYATRNNVTATVPATWGIDDNFQVSLWYHIE